jgi:hypothetical protein
MISVMPDGHEVDALIAQLRSYGITYLMGNGSSDTQERERIEPVQLLQRLAACGYPLVENACISLFILHPEFADIAQEALQGSTETVGETLGVLILATLYMQQWWLFRLTLALGRLPSFPELPFTSLWEKRRLPAPEIGYGRDGLLALQAYQQRIYHLPLNFLDDWQNQINHLLHQEEAAERELSDEVRKALL